VNYHKTTVFGLAAFGFLMAWARPEFVVPNRIYASVGHECNIYFNNVFDSATPWNYAYEALCEKGRHETRRWCWTPKKEDAGTSQRLVLRAVNDSGLVAAVTTTVTVASLVEDKSKPLSMATISASLVGCGYPAKVFEDMRKNGYTNFHAVGTKKGVKDIEKVRSQKAGKKTVDEVYGEMPMHDGNGGWTFGCFLSRYAITETEYSKIQIEAERKHMEALGAILPKDQEWRASMSKSPFIRIENGKKVVDVQMWLDKVNGGKPPDVIVMTLGVNGTFSPRNEEDLRKEVLGSQIPNAKRLIAKLREKCPNSVIGLGTPYVGSSQDAFGDNYGCVQSSVQWRHNCLYMARELDKLVKELKDPRLYVMPIGMAIDHAESYPTCEVPAHARSTRKVEVQTNALHPDHDGGWQVADAVVSFILGHWSEY